MQKILVFQHAKLEVLGTLDPMLRGAGFRIRYVNFSRFPDLKPDIKDYDGLVVLGGPMNVDETHKYPHLATEVKVIEQALKNDIPILGICLGGQLLAKTLGAKVKKNHIKEIGWYDVEPTAEAKHDALFRHFKTKQKIFQWHGDTFDIPKDAVHLASSDACHHQAFKYGDKAYGLQFHLEVDQHLIHKWLKVPDYQQEIVELKGEAGPEEVQAGNHLHMTPLVALGNQIFLEFIKLFPTIEKRVILGSR